MSWLAIFFTFVTLHWNIYIMCPYNKTTFSARKENAITLTKHFKVRKRIEQTTGIKQTY